jgi:hypothetical protein
MRDIFLRPSSDFHPTLMNLALLIVYLLGLVSLSAGAPSVAYTVMGMLCLDHLELSHAA